MTPPLADNALTALERARQAQERFERRIDVQLRCLAPCPSCGLSVIQTGEGRHPCAYCGAPLGRWPLPLYQRTDAQLRAGVNEFTEDDPPPYA